jgi:hypothetical protein
MRAKLTRYLADYAGSGVVLGAFLVMALAVCSAAILIEDAVGPPAARPDPSQVAQVHAP